MVLTARRAAIDIKIPETPKHKKRRRSKLLAIRLTSTAFIEE
ncbi:hypothetical protein NSP_49710 [Nodularia spumigena CCY9414]|nr:hypothetical protein NSP_49710 [Nodularia spumigena CCY9414]